MISSSGAKLYVQTKPCWSMPALRMLCSVMEEADIEIPLDDWPLPRLRKSAKPPIVTHQWRTAPQDFSLHGTASFAILKKKYYAKLRKEIMRNCVMARRWWLAVGDSASA